jgi:hypothetical protein
MTTKPIITEEKIDVVIGELRRKLIENMPRFNDGRYVYVEL